MSPTTLTASKRDQRLDFLRGIALLTIFINHVPGTAFEKFTSRNFGFSDAAEAFVLMSGIAAAFAYSRAIHSSVTQGWFRVGRRAFKLYRVHILITALAVLAVSAISSVTDDYGMLSRNNMGPLFSEPAKAIVGIVTFGHQFGYFNILPLYCVLLLAAPPMILCAIKRPALLLAGSVALWLSAGLARVNFPNFPNDGGWFLNPLSWQLVFAVGIVIGVAVKEGRKFCSFNPVVFAVAAAYLVFACVVVQFSLWKYIKFPALPQLLGDFNKSYVSLPRLTHILALAYVVIHLDVVTRIAESRWVTPLRVLGENSLAVFATGSVVCIALQTVKFAIPTSTAQDFALLSAGLAIQFMAAKWDEVTDVIRTKVSSASGITDAKASH